MPALAHDDVEPAELGDALLDERAPARPSVAHVGLARQIRRSRSSTSLAVSLRSSRRGHLVAHGLAVAQTSNAMMSAPSAASRTACERPCPRAAPVTSATFPATRPTTDLLVLCATRRWRRVPPLRLSPGSATVRLVARGPASGGRPGRREGAEAAGVVRCRALALPVLTESHNVLVAAADEVPPHDDLLAERFAAEHEEPGGLVAGAHADRRAADALETRSRRASRCRARRDRAGVAEQAVLVRRVDRDLRASRRRAATLRRRPAGRTSRPERTGPNRGPGRPGP